MHYFLLRIYTLVSRFLIILNLPRLLAFLILITNFKKIFLSKKCKVILNAKALTTLNELDIIISHDKQNRIMSIDISLRMLKTIFQKFYNINQKKLKNPPSMTLNQIEKSHKLSNYTYWVRVQNYQEEKMKCLDFYSKFLSILKFFLNANYIFCPNFVYSYIYDLFDAAKKKNIKCIVLMKETCSPPGHQDYIVKNFYSKTKFNGSKILFYSNAHRKHYINVEGIKNNSYVIGTAKSDLILNNFSKQKESKYEAALFFSAAIDKMNGIPESVSRELDILNKVEQFHLNFIKIANSHPNKNFLIKMKIEKHKQQFLDPLLKKFDIKLGSNISLFSENFDAADLISASKKVFVFHSTIMVEAILLNKDVIEPKLFPKNENDKSFMFSENFKNATIKVDNLDQAQKAIDSKNLITDANDKKKLVDYYFGLCDGKVFDRFISQL
jgi:hypothetical protein